MSQDRIEEIEREYDLIGLRIFGWCFAVFVLISVVIACSEQRRQADLQARGCRLVYRAFTETVMYSKGNYGDHYFHEYMCREGGRETFVGLAEGDVRATGRDDYYTRKRR